MLDASGQAVGIQLPPVPPEVIAMMGGLLDASMNEQENRIANENTSTLSIISGSSNTTIGNAIRSSSMRLPTFAYGFVQLLPSYSSVTLQRHWQLRDLFVHTSVRNRGIGSLLLTHAKKFGTDTGAASMEILAPNTGSQKLYARLEFRKESEMIQYTLRL